MSVILPPQHTMLIRDVIDILLNANKLKEVLDVIDARKKAAEEMIGNVKKIKDIDADRDEAAKLLTEATAKRDEANKFAQKKKKDAEEAFATRETAVKNGEAALSEAQQEFNKECAYVRAQIKAENDTLVKASEALKAREDRIVADETHLANEIEKYKQANAKLDALLADAKVA